MPWEINWKEPCVKISLFFFFNQLDALFAPYDLLRIEDFVPFYSPFSFIKMKDIIYATF